MGRNSKRKRKESEEEGEDFVVGPSLTCIWFYLGVLTIAFLNRGHNARPLRRR
jgi:hypothetical protein